jgi:Cdc6-like AAA superfamily ATPase
MHARVIEAIRAAAGDRHKPVSLLGEFGTGTTAILKDISKEVGSEYVNVNLHVADRYLSIPRSRDGVTVYQLINEFCSNLSPDDRPLIADNVEILFSPELGKINLVDTFRHISRQRLIVLSLLVRHLIASWREGL